MVTIEARGCGLIVDTLTLIVKLSESAEGGLYLIHMFMFTLLTGS